MFKRTWNVRINPIDLKTFFPDISIYDITILVLSKNIVLPNRIRTSDLRIAI